ncbi:MAG: Cyclic-di-AMP phosphodiesterase PgpH [Candidatus Anoxychlamydiales bacterium]|nr:Cyclic-di-AMP phosphodiesterase PgpH [Candidatus Anoxychlamydiales bacterium]
MVSDKKKRKSLKQNLKENDLGLRLIAGFIFLICLFLYLHFREVRIDVLDINAKAPKYIVAQINFEFPDDEVTILAKQTLLSQISNIYKIDESQIKSSREDFENFLMKDQNWRKLPYITYDKINDVADKLEKMMLDAKFMNSATFRIAKQFKLDIKDFIVLNFNSLDKDNLTIPKEYQNIFSKKLLFDLKNVPEVTINYVSKIFEHYDYNLVNDFALQGKIRKEIDLNILQKYTKVAAGEQIIAQGERALPRHLAMMQAMKNALRHNRNIFEPLTILGNFIIALVFIILTTLYFKTEHLKILRSIKKISLIITILILTLIFAKTIEFVLLKSTSSIIEAVRYPIVVPFAALLFSILFNSRISLFFSTFLAIVLGVTLAVEHSSFLVINLVTSLIVIISTKSLRKRTEVFKVCFKCLIGVIPVILASSFINNRLFSMSYVTNIISSFTFLLIIGILIVAILPMLENTFNVLTDITLMEYMDPNNELLRRMSLEIPGSYQHSLVLGNLSEIAAIAIGANGLFCRVATLYHDIGKLNNPNFFTENQNAQGVNIHQLLTPIESAQVIISHVTDGKTLAKKYKLPQAFIDIILEHHGTTLVYYFYHKELQLKEGDASKIDETKFRYPGPKPKTKEAAIIMITDAVEAASRSVEDISFVSFTKMVDNIVNDKAKNFQFDNCNLTFEELKLVKSSLVKTLLITKHVRIKYPEKKD